MLEAMQFGARVSSSRSSGRRTWLGWRSAARALILVVTACGNASKQGATTVGGASDAGVNSSAGGSGTMDGGSSGAAGEAGFGARQPADEWVSDVKVTVHREVSTILLVTWAQLQRADRCWLEFEFEGSELMTSHPTSCDAGVRREVVLGVPELTDTTIRVISEVDGQVYETRPYSGRTEAAPELMPRPTLLGYDAERASSARWLFGAVEDSAEGVAENPGGYFSGQAWLYIIDRQGRIVWYYNDPSRDAAMGFPRLARDGEYLWVDESRVGDEGRVLKMTLDHEYFEIVDVPGLSDAIDVTDDGSLLYDVDGEVRELAADGEERVIWNCREALDLDACYTNTVNYNPLEDSVLVSLPYQNVVVEVERSSGKLVGYYGNDASAWSFAPPLETPPTEWRFGFPHFPNISPTGTLLVSSHMPGYESFDAPPTPHQHAFIEFEIDREAQTLTEVWRYTEGPEWPRSRGMALRLENGNTLANYGTAGVIREITPDRETVFHVKFDLPGGDDTYNKMVGHNELIDDLYALNGGPD